MTDGNAGTRPDVAAPTREDSGAERKLINIALQGGGAHGAFSWGVLDRLLEDGRLRIEAISGTSAGAMNAVVVADGLMDGGEQGARQALYRFWRGVARIGRRSPIQRSPLDIFFDNWSLDHNPGFLYFDMLTRLVSPYQFNPLNLNPIRDLLAAQVDFEKLTHCQDIRLFVSATNVHTGRIKVFAHHELCADAVMASACLPFIYQAVEIDGVPYWDGGFMGNPVLYPFFKVCQSSDVMLVQINPIWRRETPRTAREILNRMNEISFNGSLLKELRFVEFVNRQVRDGTLSDNGYREIFMHRIDGGANLAPFSSSSKLNAEWMFLTHLRDLGRAAADEWLAEHYDEIGRRSSLDIVPGTDEPGMEYTADSWPALPG